MSRENGFYFVKLAGEPGWQPAKFKDDSWWIIGCVGPILTLPE